MNNYNTAVLLLSLFLLLSAISHAIAYTGVKSVRRTELAFLRNTDSNLPMLSHVSIALIMWRICLLLSRC